jgi:hypothetical protein
MAPIHFSIDVATAPERVIEALTDFSERRPERWPALDPDAYRVEALGPTTADVWEGQRSPRLRALEHYDWSEPSTVTWTVRESNFCAPGSYVSARVEPVDGGSRLHVTWDRTGVGSKGRIVVGLVRLLRGRPVADGLADALGRHHQRS